MHPDRTSLEYLQQPILPIFGRLGNQWQCSTCPSLGSELERRRILRVKERA
jgi:hypothetical protein